jgi:tRNA(adenine34) deaminase
LKVESGKCFLLLQKYSLYMEIDAAKDEKFMRLALNEARQALGRGEVPIGAVVVAGGMVIGRGHNLVETLTDATAHAEMQAITAASAELGGKYLNECTLYVTVEPCVMCTGAMAWAQLGRLVYGAPDPKRGFARHGRDLLHPRTEVTAGVLQDECSDLVTDFFQKLRRA